MKDLFEHALAVVNARYLERNYWQRLIAMAKGFSAPKTSKAYKEAEIEMQRQSAVVSAVLLPVLAALILAILTSDGGADSQAAIIEVEVQDNDAVPDLTPLPATDEHQAPNEVVAEMTSDIAMPVAGVQATVLPAPSPVQAPLPSGFTRAMRRGFVIPGLGRAGLGSSFGSTNQIKGDLVGCLYDFKRDAKGAPRASNYWEDLRRMVEGRLSVKAVRGFYRVPKQIYLSHLFVPYARAETGPEAFGVGGLMEPKGWVAHYTGWIQPPHEGRYRFVGDFDDALVVLIDGRVVLEVTWDFPDNCGGVTGWKPKANVNAHRCFTSRYLIYGDWVELRSTETHRIDILVGERPGGMIGGVLLVQREGASYETEPNGRPVLPIFAVSLLSPQERERIVHFKSMAFAKTVPMMGLVGDTKTRADALRQDDDIKVYTGNL